MKLISYPSRGGARLLLRATAAALLTLVVGTHRAAASGVSVKNGNLALNGTQWVPNGLQILAHVRPKDQLSGEYLTANQHWGAAELSAGWNTWHADMLRFQISICALDPQNSIYEAGYADEIATAVTAARNVGFKVILSMQMEGPSGCQDDSTNLPLDTSSKQSVQRAWQTIVPHFSSDPNVMFEIFNEPAIPGGSWSPSASEWNTWQNGDSGTGVVGHQAVLNTIRTAENNAGGVHHLIIAEALFWGHTFVNVPSPPLTDSVSNELAYAVHPYFTAGHNTDSSEWTTNFGNFHSNNHAVLATEWGAASKTFDCDASDPTYTANFISYMRGRNMGYNVMAFDILDLMTTDWSWDPNDYTNFTCGSGDGGPGKDVMNDFTANPAP